MEKTEHLFGFIGVCVRFNRDAPDTSDHYNMKISSVFVRFLKSYCIFSTFFLHFFYSMQLFFFYYRIIESTTYSLKSRYILYNISLINQIMYGFCSVFKFSLANSDTRQTP